MLDLPYTRAMAWRKREVEAERMKWPAGMLETCERLDTEYPGWRTGWFPEGRWYTALHTERTLSFRWARAATVEELIDTMIDLDTRAAAQWSEWERERPRGWSVLRIQ